jgi:hypothetical protein
MGRSFDKFWLKQKQGKKIYGPFSESEILELLKKKRFPQMTASVRFKATS